MCSIHSSQNNLSNRVEQEVKGYGVLIKKQTIIQDGDEPTQGGGQDESQQGHPS